MKGRFAEVQKWDALRGFLSSPRYPIRDSVAMLILIQIFSASNVLKTLLPFVMSCGFLLSIPLANLIRKESWPGNRVYFLINVLAG